MVDQAKLPAGPPLSYNVISFVLGALALFSFVFGLGSLLLGSGLKGGLLFGLSFVMGAVIYRLEMFRQNAEKSALQALEPPA